MMKNEKSLYTPPQIIVIEFDGDVRTNISGFNVESKYSDWLIN